MPPANAKRSAGVLRWVVTAVVALGVVIFWQAIRPPGRAPSVPPVTTLGRVAGAAPPVTAPAAGHPADSPSHLADELNAAAGDIHADLRTIDEIFRQYRSSTHHANPVGENAEITAALTGHNSLDFAFIPPDHPAINARGELCDRWGTPFFFHSLSGDQMEIRSAGPDRILWTPDDEVITPGLTQPQL